LVRYLVSKSGFNIALVKRLYLGEFEKVVLIVVDILGRDACGVKITHEIIEQTDRTVRLNQVDAFPRRLEERMIISKIGDPTPLRGGRCKRKFTLTAYRQQTLSEAKAVRVCIWNLGPSSKKIVVA
jgi:PadR family transcriptional regulator, regulatory protein PadR